MLCLFFLLLCCFKFLFWGLCWPLDRDTCVVYGFTVYGDEELWFLDGAICCRKELLFQLGLWVSH